MDAEVAQPDASQSPTRDAGDAIAADASTPLEADASPVMDAGSDAARESGSAEAGGSSPPADAGVDASSARGVICGSAASWPSPFPPGPSKLSAEPVGSASFGFIEGPVWIADQGVLLFSDMDFSTSNSPNGPLARIRRLKPPSTFDVFAPSANSNGLALSNGGAILAATHDNQALSLFDAVGAQRTPLNVLVDGKHFNSPNDLTVRSDGTVFFTDPDWQLAPRSSETKLTGVYRVDAPLKNPGPNPATLIEGTLVKPNGIALSPDERTLYVGSSGQEIWKYALASDGGVSGRSVFVGDAGASDGLAVDCAGNLYVTSGTVEVFAPSGMKLGEITLAETPSNAAFGGSDRKTLYITAGSHLYSVKLNVPGLPY